MDPHTRLAAVENAAAVFSTAANQRHGSPEHIYTYVHIYSYVYVYTDKTFPKRQLSEKSNIHIDYFAHK